MNTEEQLELKPDNYLYEVWEFRKMFPQPHHMYCWFIKEFIYFFSHEISILAAINATHLPENPSRYLYALPRTSYVSARAPNALKGATWVKLQQPPCTGMNLWSQLIGNRNTHLLQTCLLPRDGPSRSSPSWFSRWTTKHFRRRAREMKFIALAGIKNPYFLFRGSLQFNPKIIPPCFLMRWMRPLSFL